MFGLIKERYSRDWVTDAQSEHYVILGATTQEQANEIKELKI